MGHCIRGFIAREDDLLRAAAGLSGARVARLSLGFGFLPLSKELSDPDEPAPFDHLDELTPRLGEWAEAKSHLFPIAYIETAYHGGQGGQAAIAWVAGKVVFGPLCTLEMPENGKVARRPLLDGAINRAVRHLGVDRGAVRDEFDALGLGDHRTNESWLEAVSE